jgi:hypothetical protein
MARLFCRFVISALICGAWRIRSVSWRWLVAAWIGRSFWL